MEGTELATWSAFFSAVAGVAATLVGLLFVAVALNPAQLGKRGSAGIRIWAAQSFHSFLVVLVIGLVALIPAEDAAGMGGTLLVVGGLGFVRAIGDVRRVRRDPAPEWHGGQGVARFSAPALAHAIALWVGWQLLSGDVESVGWLVAVVFLLLISAASSCWDLVREMGGGADG